jgi:hypothetical protein
MMLDLDELTLGWECPPGELRARAVVGRDGHELLQLRVDLGVMQMAPDGRPDGQRYRGLPTVRDYVEHELRIGGKHVVAQDWQELERELTQTNYRRLTLTAIAEDALQGDDAPAARQHLERALRDVEACWANLELLDQHGPADDTHAGLRAALVFDRVRLLTQLRVVEGDYEDAIEQAETGSAGLDTLLAELGYDQEQREQDPGVRYLRDLGVQLRQDYGIARTVREQLEAAIEHEDFETAAELRDELARRQKAPPSDEPPFAPPA